MSVPNFSDISKAANDVSFRPLPFLLSSQFLGIQGLSDPWPTTILVHCFCAVHSSNSR